MNAVLERQYKIRYNLRKIQNNQTAMIKDTIYVFLQRAGVWCEPVK